MTDSAAEIDWISGSCKQQNLTNISIDTTEHTDFIFCGMRWCINYSLPGERGGQIETYLTGLDEDGLQASIAQSFIKLLYLLF